MDKDGKGSVDCVTLGVLSDTHGHLHTEVREALVGVDHIVHAGDVGGPEVLSELRMLAPVTAVRGNCDLDSWADALPVRGELELAGVRILVGHIANRLRGCPNTDGCDPTAGFAVVVTGHTHVAALEKRGGVLYLNPGSAGPTRFGRPRTVARVTIRPDRTHGPGHHRYQVRIDAEIITVLD